jgi:hypothetical protein
MGNTINKHLLDKFNNDINKLKLIDLPVLDIQNRLGHTDYIDFIESYELSDNVMKGIDYAQRHFIVIKAEIEYSNKSRVKTFTTFFQRYPDNEILWHSAGNFGTLLFNTDGGASLDQINMLHDLLLNGFYELNIKKNHILRITKIEDNNDKSIYPKWIYIGYTS